MIYGDVISSPKNGVAYAAGESIEFLYLFDRDVAMPSEPVVRFYLGGNRARHRREAALVRPLGLAIGDSPHHMDGFIAAYTVQRGDRDTDGISISENPLGTNITGSVEAAYGTQLFSGVPAKLLLEQVNKGRAHAVNGSATYNCAEVHCSTMAAANIDESGDGANWYLRGRSWARDAAASQLDGVYGSTDSSTFSYDGDEWALWRLAHVNRPPDVSLQVEFESFPDVGTPLSQAAVDRLGLSLDGAVYPLNEADSNVSNGFFRYNDPAITWAEDDEVEVRLIEMATPSFGAAAYAQGEGDGVDVTVTLDEAFSVTRVTLPGTVTGNGGATDADYSGVPESLVFASGQTSKTFTVTLVDDTEDDDGESITLSFGAESHIRTGGTNETATITITDNDDPELAVSFGAASHTVAEGGMQSIAVSLNADPERTVEIPVTAMGQNGATADDYSGVPQNVTFNTGETSKTFTFTATQDTMDDDDESVVLGFGTLPSRVGAGTPSQATVSITDDDHPEVTVSFGAATYTVSEGGTQPVTVALNADPERTVIISITATGQDGATSGDYSGMPTSVTFNAGETSKSFTFTATEDTVDDDGESVLLGFGTMPDARVTADAPAETTVSIADNDDPL